MPPALIPPRAALMSDQCFPYTRMCEGETWTKDMSNPVVENGKIMHTKRNLLRNLSLMPHPPLFLCPFPAEGLVPAPFCDGSVLDSLSLPIMESLSFHPHSRWKLYQVVSLSTCPLLRFCFFFCLFQFLSLTFTLHFHSLFYLLILVQAGAHIQPKTSDFSSFNFTFSPAFLTPPAKVAHRPPAAKQTHTHTHSHITLPDCVHLCELFLSARSSNTQVLAQSKQHCLRCKGYTSAGIRGRIWTGGTNKPQARLPSLSLYVFIFLLPHSISLFPCSQFIKSQLIFQGVWSGEWEEGIANGQKRLWNLSFYGNISKESQNLVIKPGAFIKQSLQMRTDLASPLKICNKKNWVFQIQSEQTDKCYSRSFCATPAAVQTDTIKVNMFEKLIESGQVIFFCCCYNWQGFVGRLAKSN